MKKAEISHFNFSAGFLASLVLCFAFRAQAVCSSPAGVAGNQKYNTTLNQMEFCDGTNWQTMKGNVSGQLQLGDDAAVCDASKEGTLRYNTSLNEVQFCNGTSWGSMATAGGASADPDPDPFTLTTLTNQAMGDLVYSEKVTITGFIGPVIMEATGQGYPGISVNNASFSPVVYVNPGDQIQLRMTTSTSQSTNHVATITQGSYSTTWTTTTRAGGTRMFYTSNTYRASTLYGVSGADAYCMQEASAHGYEGNWIAVMSSQSVAARDRTTIEYPVVNECDSSTIETTDLFGSNLEGVIKQGGSCGVNYHNVWTGMDSTGGIYSAELCSDWALGESIGRTGQMNRTASTWMNSSNSGCTAYLYLICMSADPVDVGDPSNIPDAITFTSETNIDPLTTVMSVETNTLTNFTGTLNASVSGPGAPEMSINSGAWTALPSTVVAGDTIRLRLNTVAAVNFTHNITLRVGAASFSWSVTTKPAQRRMFYTANTYAGQSLGGTKGADDICKSEANRFGYPGTWKAVISSESQEANVRLDVAYPIVNQCDNSVIELTDLFGSNLEGVMKQAGGCGVNYHNVWTGSNADGTNLEGSTCDSWFVGSGSGRNGQMNRTTSSWIASSTASCSTFNYLLCMSQPDEPEIDTGNTPNAFSFTDVTDANMQSQYTSNSITLTGFTGSLVAKVSGAGAAKMSINGGAYTPYDQTVNPGDTITLQITTVTQTSFAHNVLLSVGATSDTWNVTTKDSVSQIFYTLGTYVGSAIGGIDQADAICNTEASTQGYNGYWRAIMSDDSWNASDRLTLSYPIVNACDQSTVENSDLFGSTLEGVIRQAGGCGVNYHNVWTGSNSAGNKISNVVCDSWYSAVGSGQYGQMNRTTSSWINSGSAGCSSTYYLVCISQPEPTPPNPGDTPDPFTFTDLTGQNLATQITSNTITLTNFTGPSTASLSGAGAPEMSINSGAWTSVPQTVNPGDTVQLRITTINLIDYQHDVVLTVEATSDTWSVTTKSTGTQVFYTASTYVGSNLGGFSGANAQCAAEASTHGYSGNWKALMSDELRDASSYFTIDYPVTNVCDDSVVELNDLFNSTLESVIRQGGGCGVNYHNVWTGSNSTGGKVSNVTCDSWHSNVGSGQYGQMNRTTSSWINSGAAGCANTYYLICITQPADPPAGSTTDPFTFTDVTNQELVTQITSNTVNLTGFTGTLQASVDGPGNPEISINAGAYSSSPQTVSPGDTLTVRMFTQQEINKLHDIVVTVGSTSDTWSVTTKGSGTQIFYTLSTYNASMGGITGADSICATEAAAQSYGGTWKALISDESSAASSNLTITYPVTNRCNDAVVELTDLWNSTLEDVIRQAGGCGVNYHNVWTGSTNTGGIQTGLNCTDWSTTGGSGRYGQMNRTNSSWINAGSAACGTLYYLLCVSQ